MLSLSRPFHSDAPSTRSTVQPNRDSWSFSIDRLSRRDEIVLKSSMRVLDHRFQHRWTCVETGGDVRVTTNAGGGHAGSEAVLYLGGDTLVKSIAVQLPLRAREVELAFNHMGEALVRIQRAQSASTPLAYRDDEELRLQRWPSDALLTKPYRLMLATVLSARPCSVEALHRRSGLPMETCREFVRDLRTAGLLAPSIQATPAESTYAHTSPLPSRSKSTPTPQGLLTRIRARLGLVQNGSR